MTQQKRQYFALRIIPILLISLLSACGGGSGGGNASSNGAGGSFSDPGGGDAGGSDDNTDAPDHVYQVDVNSSVITGARLLNSSDYESANDQPINLESGNLFLSADELGGDDIELGKLGDGDFQVALLSGTYSAIYRYSNANTVPAEPIDDLTFKSAPAKLDRTQSKDLIIVTPGNDNNSELPKNPQIKLAGGIDASVSGNQDVDVLTFTLQLQATLNGNAFPVDVDEVAQIYLRNSESDVWLLLGSSNQQLPPVQIIPGDYEIIYQYVSGDQIPQNEEHHYSIDLTDATVGATRKEQLDVESASFRVVFSLDGGEFPNSAYDWGYMTLVAGADRVELGRSYERRATAQVIVGDYDAHYEAHEVGELTPVNLNSAFSRDLLIDSETQILNLNVATTLISGDILINGVAAPNDAYDYGKIWLYDPSTKVSVELGNTFAQQFGPIRVIPGNYQFKYEFREGGGTVPINTALILPAVLEVREAAARYDCDIPTVSIATQFSLNNQPFPNSAYNFANIIVRAVGSDEDIKLADTLNDATDAKLVAGNYDFFYRVREDNGEVPANANFKFIANKPLNDRTTIVYDFISRSIELQPTLNGEDFPVDAYRYAEIAIGSNADERVVTNSTDSAPKTINVMVGDYAVYYSAVEVADGLFPIPINTNAKIGEITVE